MQGREIQDIFWKLMEDRCGPFLFISNAFLSRMTGEFSKYHMTVRLMTPGSFLEMTVDYWHTGTIEMN